MRFFSRMSRQSTPEAPADLSSSPEDVSPVDQRGSESEQPTSPSPAGMSTGRDSEGYPTWLPKRPPPPAPASTFQSSEGHQAGQAQAGPSEQPYVGGRKPTPRSVRIVSLQEPYGYGEKDRREPTDQTRVSNPMHPRVWSRATGAGVAPTVFSSDPFQSRIPQPKFRSRGLHLELLRNPSPKSRIYFYLFQLFVFAHIPVQTFFDFNAVFILFQVSKFPNPEAPGVPGSGRNWALGAAAYIACWLVWILVVFVVYELIYSFARRWRVKRPLIYPIYLSAPAYNFVAVSSYTNFCFFQHIRFSAFLGENGSLRDGLAETFWFYSQNVPTVALLLPRAGLSLALLLSFSSPQPGVVALAASGVSHRDGTFFRGDNGTLTDYARGVLIANAAWTAWRALVLLFSWIGLWFVSGQGCGGLCGPRYRWEEEEAEKTMSVYSDNISDLDALQWSWRECTRLRIQEAYDFCLTVRPPSRGWGGKKEVSDASELLASPVTAEPLENMDQILAAVGLGSAPPPARRGVLTDDFFQGPHGEQIMSRTETPPELSSIIPKVVMRSEKAEAGPSAPLMSLPYPFTAHGAHMSSADRVPFPPSPSPSGRKSSSGPKSSSGTPGEGEDEDDDEEEEDEDDDDDEEDEGDDEAGAGTSEEPSSGRASGSMSSLGQPVSSRYPFQFRRPARGTSTSSGAPSNMTPQSNNRSMQSRISGATQATQSTGYRESTDSQSPRSHYTSDSNPASPLSQSSGVIPMPPRHPQPRQSRGRAGTVPSSSVPSSPSPINFPRAGRPRARTRTESGISEAFGLPEPAIYSSDLEHDEESEQELDEDQMMEQPDPEGSHEAAEGEDFVGLLSHPTGPSPKSSFTALRHRASSLSQHRRGGNGSRSGSNSRTNSHSGSSSSRSRANSLSISVRSRAQSLMQNIGSASHSSLELVQTVMRSRANSSMARLEEDVYYSDGRTHSRSGSGSDAVQSSGENNTFGHPIHPLRSQWQNREERVEEVVEPPSPHPLRESHSNLSVSAPSQRPSDRTASPLPQQELETREDSANLLSPRYEPTLSERSSHPDISTAAPSFITAPVTIEGATDDSGRTLSSWGGVSHMVDRSDNAWRPA